MCGIVGYVGSEEAQDILMSALARLEYRGYDSAGVASLDKNQKFIMCEKKASLLI
jgi:glucosamine--fructose-6-phosphate aminotransferase (isomerizing)